MLVSRVQLSFQKPQDPGFVLQLDRANRVRPAHPRRVRVRPFVAKTIGRKEYNNNIAARHPVEDAVAVSEIPGLES